MGCPTCDEQRDRGYVFYMWKHLEDWFSTNPCAGCGETSVALLNVDDGGVLESRIQAREAPHLVLQYVKSSEVLCVSCLSKPKPDHGDGLWGLPTNRYDIGRRNALFP